MRLGTPRTFGGASDSAQRRNRCSLKGSALLPLSSSSPHRNQTASAGSGFGLPYTQLVPMTTFDRVVGLRLLAAHQFIYELSGGRIGEQLGRVRMLLLHTTGRKTGRPRTAALLYHRDRNDYVVVGSKGGSDTPPAWLLNLKANPDVGVQVGTRRFRAIARVASAAERGALWPEVTRLWPQYERYQSQTRRPIPLVILTPLHTAARRRPS